MSIFFDGRVFADADSLYLAGFRAGRKAEAHKDKGCSGCVHDGMQHESDSVCTECVRVNNNDFYLMRIFEDAEVVSE